MLPGYSYSAVDSGYVVSLSGFALMFAFMILVFDLTK